MHWRFNHQKSLIREPSLSQRQKLHNGRHGGVASIWIDTYISVGRWPRQVIPCSLDPYVPSFCLSYIDCQSPHFNGSATAFLLQELLYLVNGMFAMYFFLEFISFWLHLVWDDYNLTCVPCNFQVYSCLELICLFHWSISNYGGLVCFSDTLWNESSINNLSSTCKSYIFVW